MQGSRWRAQIDYRGRGPGGSCETANARGKRRDEAGSDGKRRARQRRGAHDSTDHAFRSAQTLQHDFSSRNAPKILPMYAV
jgi:hypothetical protein